MQEKIIEFEKKISAMTFEKTLFKDEMNELRDKYEDAVKKNEQYAYIMDNMSEASRKSINLGTGSVNLNNSMSMP